MRARHAGALGALLVVACTSRTRIEIAAEATDVVVAARADAESNVAEVAMSRGATGIGLEVEPGDRLFTFVMPADHFVSPSGEQLDDEALASLLVGKDNQTSCRRCLAPAVTGAQVVYPGQSCPPSEAAVRSGHRIDDDGATPIDDAAEIEQIRTSIEIGASGPCACEPHLPVTSRPFDVCPLAPVGEELMGTDFAVGRDGTIVSMNAGYALRIAPDGSIVTQRFSPILEAIELAVSPDSSTTILATRKKGVVMSKEEIRLLGADLEPLGPFIAPDVRAEKITTLAADPDGIYFAGGWNRLEDETPAIDRCTQPTPGELSCTHEDLRWSGRCPRLSGQSIKALHETANGTQVAVADGVGLYLRSTTGAPWVCDQGSEAIEVMDGGERLLVTRTIEDTVVLGNRLYACAELAPEDNSRSRIGAVTALIPAGTSTSSPNDLGIEFRTTVMPLGCRGWIRLPDVPDRVFAKTFRDTFVEFDADGVVVAEERSNLMPWLGARQARFAVDSDNGWSVVIESNGGIHRQAPGASNYQRVYGTRPADLFSFRAMVSLEGGQTLALDGDGRILRAEVSRPGCEGITLRTTVDGGLKNALLCGAFPGLGPDRALISFTTTVGTMLGDLDYAAGRLLRSWPVPPEATLNCFVAGAILTSDVWILVSTGGGLFAFGPGGRLDFERIDDDPATPQVEQVASGYWLAAAGGPGVVWVGGVGKLARITASPTAPRLETFWLGPRSGQQFADILRPEMPYVHAVQSSCPDDLLIGIEDARFLSPNDLEGEIFQDLWWLTGSAGCTEATRTGPLLCPYPKFQGQLTGGGIGHIRSIAQTPGGVVVVHSQGIVRHVDQPANMLPFPAPNNAVAGHGHVLVGGPGGRLAAIVEAE